MKKKVKKKLAVAAKVAEAGPADEKFPHEILHVDDLKVHPRNYRKHPEDQLDHLVESIKTFGFYRNVVVARDNTILAGHGVIQALRRMGRSVVPVVRLPLAPDDPRALKVLTGDNEIGNLVETDDRALTELLKEIGETVDLTGTGFDQSQLAALAFTTRPQSEIGNLNEAREWVGMPAYEEGGTPIKLVISFKNDEDRERFLKETGIRIDKSAIKGSTWSTRWPWTDREDGAGLRFEET